MAVAYHGFSGPLTVEDRAWKSNLPQAFINAGYELGFDYVDINGAEQIGEAQLKLQGKNPRCLFFFISTRSEIYLAHFFSFSLILPTAIFSSKFYRLKRKHPYIFG